MTNTELLQAIYQDTQELKTRVTGIEDRVTGIEERMTGVEKRVTGIEMTLENETNPNIKVIAEGHLGLRHKLDRVLKVENEKELLLLRVNHLENELRKVKEQIDQIA